MSPSAQKQSVRPSPIARRREKFRSDRIQGFTESVIREMSRLSAVHNAVNLAQGFPDFPAHAVLKDAAIQAIQNDFNQYPITWGAKSFRNAIAAKAARTYSLDIDPETEIAVCCGATEGMIATLLAVTNPGDEVIVFEPYYENYWPDSLLCQCSRKLVKLRQPDWSFDPEELRRAFSSKTKAIILNSPNNPTGCVFGREQLEIIAGLCQEFDALAITDDIYEHIIYDGEKHIPIMQLPGMRDRTVLVNSMSKTYGVTGWRVGWVLASPDLCESIRKVHDFLTVGAATPLQEAGVVALGLPNEFYAEVAADYQKRRDTMVGILEGAGFRCFVPKGAYYIMTDISGFGYPDDSTFVRYLVEQIGVAAVPGSSFFANPEDGSQMVRFCFAKKYETLREAEVRLKKIVR